MERVAFVVVAAVVIYEYIIAHVVFTVVFVDAADTVVVLIVFSALVLGIFTFATVP